MGTRSRAVVVTITIVLAALVYEFGVHAKCTGHLEYTVDFAPTLGPQITHVVAVAYQEYHELEWHRGRIELGRFGEFDHVSNDGDPFVVPLLHCSNSTQHFEWGHTREADHLLVVVDLRDGTRQEYLVDLPPIDEGHATIRVGDP